MSVLSLLHLLSRDLLLGVFRLIHHRHQPPVWSSDLGVRVRVSLRLQLVVGRSAEECGMQDPRVYKVAIEK